MILKELKNILKFKKEEALFKYCFYVENINLYNYLKTYIIKKSKKNYVLVISNDRIFIPKNKNIYLLTIKNNFLNYFFFKNLNIKYIYSTTPDLNNTFFVKSKYNCNP